MTYAQKVAAGDEPIVDEDVARMIEQNLGQRRWCALVAKLGGRLCRTFDEELCCQVVIVESADGTQNVRIPIPKGYFDEVVLAKIMLVTGEG